MWMVLIFIVSDVPHELHPTSDDRMSIPRVDMDALRPGEPPDLLARRRIRGRLTVLFML